jgi:CRP/FNR family cyclic AMP-dependent transcriptional regulator
LLQQYCAEWLSSSAIRNDFLDRGLFLIWNPPNLEPDSYGGRQLSVFTLVLGKRKIETLFRQKEVRMSPARQPKGSPRPRKIVRPPLIDPTLRAAKNRRDFDPHAFLATIGEGREFVLFPKKQTIFTQGDPSDAVFYVQTGKVKLTVVSKEGKEATIGIVGDGDFFGEGALAGQPFRMGSATALTDCAVLRINKTAMMDALHREHAFSDLFVAYLLARNIRYEEDLVDQLFNSSEKRLARLLLLLAHFGKEGKPETVVPKISQETLAEMVGTTRSRVSFFMNRFRKLGFVHYNGGLQVHSSLLNVVLHD